MTSRRIFFGLFAVSGLALVSYGIVTQVRRQIKRLMQYCYKIDGFTLKKISKDKIIITLHVLFKNVSDIDIMVNNYSFDVSINGTYVATIKKNIQQYIKANDISKFDMDIEFDPKLKFTAGDIAKLLIYAVSNQEKFIIDINGKFEVKHSFLKVNMPLDMKFTLKEILSDDENTETCKI